MHPYSSWSTFCFLSFLLWYFCITSKTNKKKTQTDTDIQVFCHLAKQFMRQSYYLAHTSELQNQFHYFNCKTNSKYASRSTCPVLFQAMTVFIKLNKTLKEAFYELRSFFPILTCLHQNKKHSYSIKAGSRDTISQPLLKSLT